MCFQQLKVHSQIWCGPLLWRAFMKRWAGFSACNSAKFDQIHILLMDRLPSAIYDMQRNHCNCSQFRSARLESVRRHFGMLRAFLMLSEQ